MDSASNAQIHLLGNIVLWHSASLSIVVYFGLLIFYLLRRRRFVYDLAPDKWIKFRVSWTRCNVIFIH